MSGDVANPNQNATVLADGLVRGGVPTLRLIIVRDSGDETTVYLDAEALIDPIAKAMAGGPSIG